MDYDFLVNGKPFNVSLEKKDDRYLASIGEKKIEVRAERISENTISLEMDGRVFTVHGAEVDGKHYIALRGYHIVVEDAGRTSAEKKVEDDTSEESDGTITTPMPGNIVKVLVSEDQTVEKGESLVIVESMKMENVLSAPASGVVKKIHVSAGDQTQFGQVLIELDLEQEG